MLPLLTPALEALIKLFEGISSIEKTKFQNKQTIFKEIAQPLFEELEPLASSYVEFFKKSRQMIIEDQQDSFLSIARKLRENREALLMARIKVTEMANQIRENIDDEGIIEFATSIDRFFYSASRYPRVNSPWKSKVITFIEYLENTRFNRMHKKEVLEKIDEILQNIENEWALVIRSYESLKINSSISQKYIKKHVTKKIKH